MKGVILDFDCEGIHLSANLLVSEEAKKPSFITSPRIDALLQSYSSGQKIGFLAALVMKNGTLLRWTFYSPYRPHALEVTKKLGLASQAERLFLIRAKKEFPSLKFILHERPVSEKRRKQLRSRGLLSEELNLETSFAKEMTVLRKKIAQNRLAQRKKAKPSFFAHRKK